MRARSPFAGYGGADEKEQTLNQLLSEFDGFDPRTGSVLLAATNWPEILDLVLACRASRPGGYARPSRPQGPRSDPEGRKAAAAVNVTDIAGITGAYLAYLVNEAAIFATRRSADQITMNDFTNAVERIVAGAEWRGRLLKHENHARVAYH